MKDLEKSAKKVFAKKKIAVENRTSEFLTAIFSVDILTKGRDFYLKKKDPLSHK